MHDVEGMGFASGRYNWLTDACRRDAMAKEWPKGGHADLGAGARQTAEKNLDRLSQMVLEADVCLAEGLIDQARSRLSAALSSLPLGDKRRAVIRYRLGMVELEAGDYDAALDHIGEARRAYERAGLDDRVRACNWGKAIAKIGLGDWEGALKQLEELRASYVELGQEDLADWTGQLLSALETGLPAQKVRRIARAKPAGKEPVAEEPVLRKMLAKLMAMQEYPER